MTALRHLSLYLYCSLYENNTDHINILVVFLKYRILQAGGISRAPLGDYPWKRSCQFYPLGQYERA